MNEQIDETKAPAALPRFLPIGTQWTANRGGVNRYVFMLGSRAENDGGWIRGSEQWEISGDYVRIHPDYEILASGPPERTNIMLNEIDWPSYYAALRSAPESREFKRGDRVSGVLFCEPGRGTSVVGAFVELGYGYAWVTPELGVDMRRVKLDSLRHEPAQREAKAPGPCDCRCSRDRSCGAHEPDCALVAARIAAKDNDLGWGGTRAKPVEPARADPYRKNTVSQCRHQRANLLLGQCSDCGASSMEACAIGLPKPVGPHGYLQWSDQQDKIAAAKAKHLADFDRAAKPKYGVMGDRCKFGAKLGGGWETEPD